MGDEADAMGEWEISAQGAEDFRDRPRGQSRGQVMSHSTRDPRHAGMKSAVLARLHDRLKVAAEFSEPGYAGWKQELVRRDLLRELITEFEAMHETEAT